MKTWIKLFFFVFIVYACYQYIQGKNGSVSFSNTIDRLKTEVNQDSITSFYHDVQEEWSKAKTLFQEAQNTLPDWNVEKEQKKLEQPNLTAPTKHTFSIYNIQIGDKKASVENQLGEAKRHSRNEYGIDWYVYHQNYQHYVMVAYDEQQSVTALYTNQDLIASKIGIQKGTSKSSVLKTLGKPLTELQKGFVYYKLPADRDYEMFLLDKEYVTVFFDKEEANTVTAMQIIAEGLEEKRNDFYTKSSSDLQVGFEYQLFDLTNASRVNNGLSPLKWDDHVKETARKHSKDMAVNNYFDHTNLEEESPFDRMLEDGIRYHTAGENLAYGQYSSIFAHEGLMNSPGHRKNILQKSFNYLGIGVAFNANSQPYYTENFYSP
ncbi:CAP-associated domain-containing protein [Niallia sp. 01092]|uniref:CAP-associated domain-containing protein n=1 Tax=unclassified Niallia TaxID=2837522 RepID=UPI003FD1B091